MEIAYQFQNEEYHVTCSHCHEQYIIKEGIKEFHCKKNHDHKTIVSEWVKKTHKKQLCEMTWDEIEQRDNVRNSAKKVTRKRAKGGKGIKVNYYKDNEKVETFDSVGMAAEYFDINYHKFLYQFRKGTVLEKYGIDLRCDESNNRKKIILTENEKEIEFKSIHECARYLKDSYSSMQAFLKGKRKIPYPYDVRYAEEKK